MDVQGAGRPLALQRAGRRAIRRFSGATQRYFTNAPVGKIFGAISDKMVIPPIGLYDTQMQNLFTTQLTNVETKGTDPTKAFSDALGQISQVTG